MEPDFDGAESAFYKGRVPILATVGRWEATSACTRKSSSVLSRRLAAWAVSVKRDPDHFSLTDFGKPRRPPAHGGNGTIPTHGQGQSVEQSFNENDRGVAPSTQHVDHSASLTNGEHLVLVSDVFQVAPMHRAECVVCFPHGNDDRCPAVPIGVEANARVMRNADRDSRFNIRLPWRPSEARRANCTSEPAVPGTRRIVESSMVDMRSDPWTSDRTWP
jgi:hypothetical protein